MTLYVCSSDEIGCVQGGMAIDACAVQKDTQMFFVGLSRVGALSPGEHEENVECSPASGVSFIHSSICLPISFQFTDI